MPKNGYLLYCTTKIVCCLTTHIGISTTAVSVEQLYYRIAYWSHRSIKPSVALSERATYN